MLIPMGVRPEESLHFGEFDIPTLEVEQERPRCRQDNAIAASWNEHLHDAITL